MVEKLPLSLIIVTRDETRNVAATLARCIRSVPFASDILVLDSIDEGATLGPERVADVARRLGARVQQEPWRGFAKQKMRATALARNEWVLALEIDEALSPDAQTEIAALFADNKLNADAFQLARLTFYISRFLYHGGAHPNYQTRLFHRERAKWADGETDAAIEAPLIAKLKGPLYQWPYENISAQIETVDTRSTQLAAELLNQNKTFSRAGMLRAAWVEFTTQYFVKRGYKDGVDGLLAALFSAVVKIAAWSKVYEHNVRVKAASK